MAQFSYKATDGNHHISQGIVSAKSRLEASHLLERKSLSPLVIREISGESKIKGSIPQIEKMTLCRYLAVTLSSGLALTEGIDVLRSETKHPLLGRILADMSYSLEQGQQLSTIYERYPDTFEPYFLTLVRAGEISGKLAEVFHHLEAELRAEYSMQAKVKGALLYPMVVFTAMISIGFLMFFFVLPQIGKVFLNLNLPLPAATKFLFTSSITLSHYFIQIVTALLVFVIFGVILMRQKKFRSRIFLIFEFLPFIRNFLKQIDLARFSRIFSTLLKSAVPITEALQISLQSLSLSDFQKLTKSLPDELRKGKTLASVMKQSKAFPGLLIQMVAAGEKSAQLQGTLADLATFYEEEVEEKMKNLAQILEPILMLLVGISVGVLILSIIAPIYSVIGSFQQSAGNVR